MLGNTQRFSDRVEDYIRYRPHYPIDVLDILKSEYLLTPKHTIADIGSGTGISSEIFVNNGNKVYAIEPNTEMRFAAESLNKGHSNFISRDGTGECTGLPDSSIDFIICAQTFHWLDTSLAKKEFLRILKPTGKVVLIWNERSVDSEFQKEYEETLYRCVSAYKEVTHRDISESVLSDFFSPRTMTKYQLPNFQDLDLNGLIGRMMSSSYIPKEGKEHLRLISEITQLFHNHQLNSKVRFEYRTSVYIA
jgi:SAM-dependent methyltransferase